MTRLLLEGLVRRRALLPLAAALAAVSALAGCGSAHVHTSGLTAADRDAAAGALAALHGTNIPVQVLSISQSVQEPPATCRVHLLSTSPRRFQVFVFWVPWLAGEDYTWLDMTVGEDPKGDAFRLGAAHPVLPGGQLSANGRTVVGWTVDTTLLSRYGEPQARKGHRLMLSHAGQAFAQPGGSCRALANGDLRLADDPG